MRRVPRLAPPLLFVLLATAVTPPQPGSCQVEAFPEPGPSYGRTLLGTAGVGVAGAALVGGTFALLGEVTSDGDEFLSPTQLGLIYGGVIGYWLGQAVGGSLGSATDAGRVPVKRLLVPAAIWTGAGLVVFGLVGSGFEVEDSPGTDASWYVGAAAGALVQLVGMSIATHRIASNESRGGSHASLRLYPSADGGLAAALRFQPRHPW